MMDPELAAASVLMERPNIEDQHSARALALSLRETSSSAEEETLGRVEFEDRDIPCSDGNESIVVRIYRPTDTTQLRPAVVFFHGGAFVLGDLESEHPRCLRYAAEAGCVVISINYRLAPEHPFPSGVEDCYSGLLWVVEHANELNIDTSRVALAGSSAGGALAAATALIARDRNGPVVALQMLLYPVLDDRMQSTSMSTFADTPVWDSRNNRAMWRQYLSGTANVTSYAAPARELTLEGLPSTYIMTAELDPLRDEAISYALRLLQAGVSVELHQIAGAYHGFDQLVADAAISRRALDDQVHHLKRFLRT
ncbi:acetyl esterase/lipase [Marisediminicola sp. UYEF4]|uniref:alpha/beta hydrolase n=1 Tax=Marisediminicola sp. UYEF4 TaxID=1756384 RepID=UPI003396661D